MDRTLDQIARENAAIHNRYRSKSPIHYERPPHFAEVEAARFHQYQSRFGAEPVPRYHRTSASNVAHLSPEPVHVVERRVSPGRVVYQGPPMGAPVPIPGPMVRERVVGHSS